jgi:pyruvate kinase
MVPEGSPIADPGDSASPEELLAALRALRSAVAAEGRAGFARWRPLIARRSFAISALNLAHYRALRHRDVRPLQRPLMRLGLSSLGRLEGRVLAGLDAVIAALQALVGSGACRDGPDARQFFRGEDRLRAAAERLFGPAEEGREARILVTLPAAAAEQPDEVLALARRGMSAARINCAHDDPAIWQAMIDNVGAAARAVGRPIPILMDIAGPKCRTAAVRTPPERKRLQAGDRLLLAKAALQPDTAFTFQATCSLPGIVERLAVGDRVYVDDGHFGGVVEALVAPGALVRIEQSKLGGGKLKAEKGLNFPDTELGLKPLTDKDLADLDFVARRADMIGYSFVEQPADIVLLQEELAKRRPDWARLGLVAKIETPRAVRNLPDLIVQAAGRQPFAVMIARGDLAVEIGFVRMAEMQEEILWLCEAAHIPVIWATQVLESLVKTGLASRGEMTDAAMAGRAECVMLNKGPNVAAAVEALDRLLRRMAGHQSKKTPQLRALRSW